MEQLVPIHKMKKYNAIVVDGFIILGITQIEVTHIEVAKAIVENMFPKGSTKQAMLYGSNEHVEYLENWEKTIDKNSKTYLTEKRFLQREMEWAKIAILQMEYKGTNIVYK